MRGIRDGLFTEKYLRCERCGAYIWEGEDYKSNGYGGFICARCIDEEQEEEDGIPGDDKAR